MHDLMLAKEIIDKLMEVAEDKKAAKIRSASLEIGNIAHGDHLENVDLDNLIFLLKSITPKYSLDKAKFNIKKTTGDSWKITDIEV